MCYVSSHVHLEFLLSFLLSVFWPFLQFPSFLASFDAKSDNSHNNNNTDNNNKDNDNNKNNDNTDNNDNDNNENDNNNNNDANFGLFCCFLFLFTVVLDAVAACCRKKDNTNIR